MTRRLAALLICIFHLSASGCGEGVSVVTADAERASFSGWPQWPATAEDDIKGVATAAAKYTSCTSLWSCAVASCGKQSGAACLHGCLAVASEKVVQDFQHVTQCAVNVCAVNVCAKNPDPGCMAACMWERCLGFAAACGAEAAQTGSATCGGALGCVPVCKTDMGCIGSCFTAMSHPEQQSYLTLWSCTAQSTAAKPNEDCYDKAIHCAASGDTAADDCFDILQCSGTCGTDLTGQEFSCNVDCYSEGTAKAQRSFEAVVNCYTGFSQGKSPGTCSATLQACVVPSGTLTCPEIDPCRQRCRETGKSDGVCTFACLRQAKDKEARLFLDLTLCASVTCKRICADSGDVDCIKSCVDTTCKDRQALCLGG